jgi:PAS domain S-box-containing protein
VTHLSALRRRLARFRPQNGKIIAVYFAGLLLAVALFAAVAAWVDQQAQNTQERLFNDQQALQTLLVRQAFEDHMGALIHESGIVAVYSLPEYVRGRRTADSVRTLFQIEQTTYPEYLAHLYVPATGSGGQARFASTPAGAAAELVAQSWVTSHWAQVAASPNPILPIVPPLYITRTYQLLGLLFPVRVNGQFQGVLAVVVNLQPLVQRYIVPMRSGQYGAGYLLDGQGNVVFDHETEIIGRNVFDGMHAKYPDVIRLDQRLIAEPAGTDEYHFTVVRGGPVSRKLIAWHTAQAGDQKLIIALAAPDGEIEAGLRDLRLQRNLLTAALGLFLLLGSLAFFQTRQRLLEQNARSLQTQVEQRTAALVASQESLRASQETLQALFDVAPLGIILLDQTGKVQLWNLAAARILGWSAEEVLGGPNPLAQAAGAPEWLKQLHTGAALVSQEVVLPRHDGTPIGISLSAAALHDATGQVRGQMAILADITERIRAEQARQQVEEKLRALNADLEQRVTVRTAELSARTRELDLTNQQLTTVNADLGRALLAKDEFLATMSHELRTPLTGVLGLSESLQMDIYGPLNSDQRQAVANLYTCGQHLLELINDILDLAKVEAGKLALEAQLLSVREVCQTSLKVVQEQARKKQLQILFTTDLQASVVRADARRLRQILVNLLSNAVKFTPAGGTVGLEVQVDAQRNIIQFEVWDTGIGIAPEAQARLFQPFVQIDSSLSRQYEGTGLGLVLVRRLVDLHGGSVSLESKPGLGSRFKVSLPWSPANEVGAEVAAPVESAASPAAASGHLPAGLRILVADDNPVFLKVTADVLRQQGAEVRLAANGLEATELARAWRPELILMDIQMPVMDGLEAIRHIRAQPGGQAAPIVALTALALKGDREACLDAGATDYVAKPVSLETLLQIIRGLVH